MAKKFTPVPFKEFLPKFLRYAEHKRQMAQEHKRREKALEDVDIPEDDPVIEKLAKEDFYE